jgi:type IV pilus assembly protein PilE
MPKKIHAFSLIEMLVVVAIISIVGVLAYPTYTHYFMQQRRLVAKSALYQLASALDNYYAVYDSYQDVSLAKLGLPATVADEHYRLEIQSLAEQHYVVTATPLQSQTSDKLCGTLSLTSTGERHNSGRGHLSDCW